MDSLGAAEGRITLDASGALRALDQVGAGLKNLESQSGQFGAGFASWTKQHEQSLTTLGQGFTAVGLGITAAFGIGVKASASFEAQLSGIAAVTGATAGEMDQLREVALRLGADTSTSATQAALGIEELAKAGIPVSDIMNGAADSMIALSEAGGISVPLAANIMAAAMGQFNIAASDSVKVADALAGAANASLADVDDLGMGLAQVGGIAASFGFSLEETVAALAAMADAGIKGSDAATSLKSAMLQMGAPTDKAAAAMSSVGFSVVNADGSMKSLDQTVRDLAVATAGMTEEQRINFLSTIAGSDGYRALDSLLGAFNGTVSEQDAALSGASNSWEHYLWATSGGIEAADVAKKRMDNLAGSFEELKGTFETVAIVFTSHLLPALRAAIDAITSALQVVLRLPEPVQAGIVAFTGLVGILSLAAGGFLLLLPRIATTIDAFNDLKTSAAGAKAINGITTALGNVRGGAAGARTSLMGLVRMHPLLVGIGLVAGAIGLAYRTNFLGIGDAIDGVVAKVSGVASAMRDAFAGAGQEAAIAAEDVAAFAEATKVVDGVTVYTAFTTNADGTKREVGEIVESVANADGTTAQVLIEGDAGQYWATIDLATGQISNAEIQVQANTQPLHERINASLNVLKTVFNNAGVGWAADIVDNLQGVVTWIAGAAATIKSVFGDVSQAINGVLGTIGIAGAPVQAFLTSLGTAAVVLAPLTVGLGLIGKAFATLSPVLTIASVAIKALGVAIAILTSPIGLVVVGVAALAAGLVYAYKNFEPFRKIVDKAADAIKDFATGPALDFLQDVGDGLSDALDAVTDFVNGIDSVSDAFSDVTRLISGFRFLVGSLFDSLAAKAGVFGSTIQRVGALFENGLRGWESLIRGIGQLFSGDLTGALASLGDVALAIFQNIGQALLLIPQLIVDTFQAIPWGSLASGAVGFFASLGSAALTALQGMSDTVQISLQLAWDAITSINWSDYVPSLVWDIFVAAVDLAAKVGAFVWDTFVKAVDLAAKVGAFVWDVFVTAVDLAAKVGSFVWGTFVTAVDLAKKVGVFAWDTFVMAVDLAAKVGTFAWDAFVTAVDLAAKVGFFAWSAFVTVVDLAAKVGSFAWSIYITAVDLALKVGEFAWSVFITGVNLELKVLKLVWSGFVTAVDLAAKVGAFAWSAFVTAVDLAGKVGSFAWSSFVTAIDLTTKVAALAWSSFVTALTTWSDFVSSISWSSFVPDVAWSEFIPDLSWPSVDQILEAIKSVIGISSGGSLVPDAASEGPDPNSTGDTHSTSGPLPRDPNANALNARLPFVLEQAQKGGVGMDTSMFAGIAETIRGIKAAFDDLYASLTTTVSGLITTGQTFTQLYATMTPVVSGAITVGTTFTQLYAVLTTVVSGLITVGTTFTQLYATLTPLVSGLITLGMTFTQLYAVLTTTVSGLITTGLTFTQIYATLTPLVSGLITLGLTFTQLYTVLTTVVSGLITTGLTFSQIYLTLPPIVSGLITLGLTFTQLYTVLTTIVSGLITTGITFTQLGTVITTLTTSFITFVASTIGVMGGWTVGIQTMITTTMSAFQTGISTGTSTGKQSFITFVGDVIGVMGGWTNGIQTMVSTTMSSFRSNISSGTSTGKQSFITFVGDTIGVMGGWSGGVRNIVSGAMSGVVSAIQTGMQTATTAISVQSAAWSTIIGSRAGAMSAAGTSAGQAAGAGVAQGMLNALPAIVAAANAIVSNVDRAMRSAARIASPAKRFMPHGLNIALGPAKGMTSPQALRGLRNAADTVIGTLDRAFSSSSLSAITAPGMYGSYGASAGYLATLPTGSTTYITHGATYGDTTYAPVFNIKANDTEGIKREIFAELNSDYDGVNGLKR